MKQLLLLLLLSIVYTASAQRVSVEARDGKAMIVNRDTLATGETTELAEWKINPSQVLAADLTKSERELKRIIARMESDAVRAADLSQRVADLKIAIEQLNRGLLETGIPGKTTPTPPAKKKAPAKPKPKKE